MIATRNILIIKSSKDKEERSKERYVAGGHPRYHEVLISPQRTDYSICFSMSDSSDKKDQTLPHLDCRRRIGIPVNQAHHS